MKNFFMLGGRKQKGLTYPLEKLSFNFCSLEQWVQQVHTLSLGTVKRQSGKCQESFTEKVKTGCVEKQIHRKRKKLMNWLATQINWEPHTSDEKSLQTFQTYTKHVVQCNTSNMHPAFRHILKQCDTKQVANWINKGSAGEQCTMR